MKESASKDELESHQERPLLSTVKPQHTDAHTYVNMYTHTCNITLTEKQRNVFITTLFIEHGGCMQLYTCKDGTYKDSILYFNDMDSGDLAPAIGLGDRHID